MSNTVLRRAVNGLIGMFGGKRTQNVFSPFASNRCRPPASGGFVATQSASDHARFAPREPPAVGPIFRAVRGMTAIDIAALKPLVTPLTGYAARHDFRPSVVAVDGPIETQNVFSAVASKFNVFRQPANDGFVTSGSVADSARPKLRGTPGRRNILTAVREMLTAKRVQLPTIGINGFGQVGRSLLRLAICNYNHVVAINEPSADLEFMVRSFREDPLAPWDRETVRIEGDKLCVDDKLIRVCHEKNPENIDWRKLGVNYVIDLTANCTDLATAMKHISPGGAKKVIITSPTMDVPRLFKCMNYPDYQENMSVVSTGSSAANCAVPIICIMRNNFVIYDCMVNSTCLLKSDRPMDAVSTSEDIMLRIRELKFNAGAIPELHSEIPMKVAYMKLFFRIDRNVSVKFIKTLINDEVMSFNEMITDYSSLNEPIVSDFRLSHNSAIVDINHIFVHDKYVVIGAWYNRSMGFAFRALDLTNYIISMDEKWYHRT